MSLKPQPILTQTEFTDRLYLLDRASTPKSGLWINTSLKTQEKPCRLVSILKAIIEKVFGDRFCYTKVDQVAKEFFQFCNFHHNNGVEIDINQARRILHNLRLRKPDPKFAKAFEDASAAINQIEEDYYQAEEIESQMRAEQERRENLNQLLSAYRLITPAHEYKPTEIVEPLPPQNVYAYYACLSDGIFPIND